MIFKQLLEDFLTSKLLIKWLIYFALEFGSLIMYGQHLLILRIEPIKNYSSVGLKEEYNTHPH